jgi:hypothetical protein
MSIVIFSIFLLMVSAGQAKHRGSAGNGREFACSITYCTGTLSVRSLAGVLGD